VEAALPLVGTRVVALEQAVAAPLCTRHLADLGADVIKVEPPGGEFGRGYDDVVYGQSSYFVWLNGGKRSVVLDLKIETGRHHFEDLLGSAIVFVHNLGPGAVERLGFGWQILHQRWPGLISCGISGYGMNGPQRDRKAFDLLLQGESGVVSLTGSEEQPAKVGVSIADIASGMYALSAILAALLERERTGTGHLIDISMLECLAEWVAAPAYFQRFRGRPPARTGLRHHTIVPYGAFRIADGSLMNLAVQNDGQWKRLCEGVLERPDLSADSRFESNILRVRNRTILEPLIEEVLSRMERDDLERRLEAWDVPFGAIHDMGALLDHPQLRERGRWGTVVTSSGTAPALEHPINIVGLRRPPRSVPGIGQHTEEVLRELSTTPSKDGTTGKETRAADGKANSGSR
jgi:itaconate CoA-transferase